MSKSLDFGIKSRHIRTEESLPVVPHEAVPEVSKGKVYTGSSRASRGREFQREKTIKPETNLPIECAQGDRPARCPNHPEPFFAVNEPSAVPWW